MKDQNFHETPINLKAGFAYLGLQETYRAVYKALNFILSSSILLSLNGVMVVVFGSFLVGAPIVAPLLLAAFLVTFSVYGLNKFTDKAEDLINRPETIPKASNHYLVFSIVAMLCGFLIGLWEGMVPFLVLLTPIIIGVIYSVKISKSIPRLKEIVGVKSFVVALSWALTGSLLPEPFSTVSFQVIVIVFVYIFIRVFVGATLCDFLDTKGDLASGVKTIPIVLGKNRTKKLLIFLNSLGIVLPIYSLVTGTLFSFFPAMIFGVLFGYFAIWFFFRNKCKRFTAGIILDGEWIPIVIMICLLIR